MRFLVGVDLEDDALDVLLQASSLVTALGNAATVFDVLTADSNATETALLGSPEERTARLEAWNGERLRMHNRVERLLFRLPSRMRGNAIVRRGDPVVALVRHAVDYDAVIVGSRAHPMPSRGTSAGVAERVARCCPVPVLTVRRSATAAFVPVAHDSTPLPSEPAEARGRVLAFPSRS